MRIKSLMPVAHARQRASAYDILILRFCVRRRNGINWLREKPRAYCSHGNKMYREFFRLRIERNFFQFKLSK